MKKRLTVLVLCVLMLLTLAPAAFAEEDGIIASGSDGTINWTLDENHVLTFTGTGPVGGSISTGASWWSYRDQISTLVFGGEITRIDYCPYFQANNVKSIYIGDSVTEISGQALTYFKALENVYIGNGVKTIGNGAFQNSRVNNLTLGASVEYMGKYAMDGFPRNTNVYYAGTEAQRNKIKGEGLSDWVKGYNWHYEHTHDFTVTETVAPTCTELGYTVLTCSGGETIKDHFVPALGHDPVVVPGKPATYYEDGITDGSKCARCGKVLSKGSVIAKKYHSMKQVDILDLTAPDPTAAELTLDRDFTINASFNEGYVTEGENAPWIEWYAFDTRVNLWMPQDGTEPDLAGARAYMAVIGIHPEETYKFYKKVADSSYTGTVLLGGEPADSVAYVEDDGELQIAFVWQYYYPGDLPAEKLVFDVKLTDVPTFCTPGGKVSELVPATLEGDGGAVRHMWSIVKNDADGNTVGIYFPPSEDALVQEALGASADDLRQLRKDFGTTFDSNYTYVYVDCAVLSDGYAWASDKLKKYVSFDNGESNSVQTAEVEPLSLWAELNNKTLKSKTITKPAKTNVWFTGDPAKVIVNWKPVAGADKYEVWRSTDGKTFKKLSTTTKTTLNNVSVESGKTYYYKVRAVNEQDGKTYYASYSEVNSIYFLAQPTVKLSVSSGYPKLSWNKVAGADSYEVYRADLKSSGYGDLSYIGGTVSTSYTDKTAKAGKSYVYVAVAIHKLSDANYKRTTPVEVLPVTKLSAPTLTLTPDNGKVKLSWGKVSGAAKYEVWRSSDNKTFSKMGTTTKLSYTNSSAKSSTKYYYKVRAVDEFGNAFSYSSVKSIILLDAPMLKSSLNGTKVTLSWAAVKGATSYNVYRDGELIARTTKLKVVDYGLVYGTKYTYAVEAVYSDGSSITVSVADEKLISPKSQPKLAVIQADGKAKLTWVKTDGAAKYQVWRSTDNKKFTQQGTTTKLSYTNSSAKAGTKYYYKVRPVMSDGSLGRYSDVVSITLLGTPTVTVKTDGTTAKLSWKKLTGAADYNVYRLDKNGDYQLLGCTKELSFSDKGLTRGSSYSYKVQACSSTVMGELSAEKTAYIMKPAAPVFLQGADRGEKFSGTLSDNALYISWGRISAGNGSYTKSYELYRSTDNSTWTKVYSGTKTCYKDTKVTSGTTYYYRLRATDANGSVSPYTDSAKTVFLSAPVIKSVYSVKDDASTVKWEKVKGATGYLVYLKDRGLYDNWTFSASLSEKASGCSFKGYALCSYYVIPYKTVGDVTYYGEKSNTVEVFR